MDALDISKATALLIKEITQIAHAVILAKNENQTEKDKHDALSCELESLMQKANIMNQISSAKKNNNIIRKGSVSNCSRLNPYNNDE
jgi:hypothetical protein